MHAGSAPSTRAGHVNMVEALERNVGVVLAALERNDLARNSIVIFTNDNGEVARAVHALRRDPGPR